MIDQGESWRRIAARVEAMTRAAETSLLAQRVQSEDPYGLALKVFGAQGKLIHQQVRQFLDRYAAPSHLRPNKLSIVFLEQIAAVDGSDIPFDSGWRRRRDRH